MRDPSQKTITKEEFNRELVRALDDLVTDGRYHAQQIKESLARTDELRRQRALEARETPPPYRIEAVYERFDGIEQRFDRLERTLADIRERMATKVEVENTNDNVKKVADGYITIGQRLDAVAEMLKPRVILP